MKNNKGITLISLILSIIVLGILSTVVVKTVKQKNGSIAEAKNSKEEVRAVSIQKVRDMWVLNSKEGTENIEEAISRLNQDRLITKDEETKIRNERKVTVAKKEIVFELDKSAKEESETEHVNIEPGIVATKNELYIQKDPNTGEEYRAIIPKGFAVSKLAHEQSIKNGLVIYDIPKSQEHKVDWSKTGFNKYLNVQEDYNQLVWIPIDKFTFEEEFSRGFFRENKHKNYREPDKTGENPLIGETEYTKREARELYESVRKNGGYYFGRYETGKADKKPVIKRNASIVKHLYIAFGENFIEDPRNEYALGAGRWMYKYHEEGKGTHGVVSTLCYGVEWDSALRFIATEDPGYINNSEKKGNYNHINVDPAGEWDEYRRKNIYDMAGNVWEWTMEYGNGYRITRGGSFIDGPKQYPASARFETSNDHNSGSLLTGFRVCAYIKE